MSAFCKAEDACNNHALKHDDVVDSIEVSDIAIHCTKDDDAFTARRNIFIKYGNYIGSNTVNNASPRVPTCYTLMSVLFEIPFIYFNIQHHVEKRANGGVKRISVMIISVYIMMLLLQGTVYCFNQLYASTRILIQTRNNSNNNQCNNNNNTNGLVMSYTNMNILIGLYCVNPSMSLCNVRLPNVHTMTTVEMLALSLLELFDKCLKRIHVMKLSIVTELDLSVNTRKLGVGNIEYRKRIWY